jgi:glucitol operon activator protein
MVSALITVAAIAWIAQLAFGGWQIRRFNRAFDTLCQQGRVRPRAIVAIAVDEHDRVSGTLLMKGLTVFARPQQIPALEGKLLQELRPDMIFPHDPLCRNALSLALKPKHV